MYKTRLRDAAEFFHDREGRLLQRGDAVTGLAQRIDGDERTASRLLAGLTGDEVDPVVAVPTARETFVGVLDYHEGDGWYGYTDYHDFHGERRVGVCARCVHDAISDSEVYRTTSVADSWSTVAADLRRHLERAHPSVTPEAVPVETGAVLRSRTTVGGNRVWHVGNDGAGSGFGSASVDGFEAATLNRSYNEDASSESGLPSTLGLKGWWTFDIGSGSTVPDHDSVGQVNSGSTIGGTTWTDGQYGNAMNFNGDDAGVEIANYGRMPERVLTVTFWVKTTQTGSGAPFSYAHDGSSNNEFLVFTPESLTIYITGPSVDTGVAVNDGTWTHVAIQWRSSDGMLKLFTDGNEAFSTTHESGSVISDGGGLVFGQEQDSELGGYASSQAYAGDLDDVRIYERIVPQDEIRDIRDGNA